MRKCARYQSKNRGRKNQQKRKHALQEGAAGNKAKRFGAKQMIEAATGIEIL